LTIATESPRSLKWLGSASLSSKRSALSKEQRGVQKQNESANEPPRSQPDTHPTTVVHS
jgi:hypothetical protein